MSPGLLVQRFKVSIAHSTVRLSSLSLRSQTVTATQRPTATRPCSRRISSNALITFGVESFFAAASAFLRKAKRASRLPSLFASFLISCTKVLSSFILLLSALPSSGRVGSSRRRAIGPFRLTFWVDSPVQPLWLPQSRVSGLCQGPG